MSEVEVTSGGNVEATAVEVKEPAKVDADAIIASIEECGRLLRDAIVKAKQIARTPGLEPHQDQGRALAMAQSHLQTGFMWLRRSVKPTKDF